MTAQLLCGTSSPFYDCSSLSKVNRGNLCSKLPSLDLNESRRSMHEEGTDWNKLHVDSIRFNVCTRIDWSKWNQKSQWLKITLKYQYTYSMYSCRSFNSDQLLRWTLGSKYLYKCQVTKQCITSIFMVVLHDSKEKESIIVPKCHLHVYWLWQQEHKIQVKCLE